SGFFGRQARGHRGNFPAEISFERVRAIHQRVEDTSFRLDWILLGKTTRRTAPISNDSGWHDVGMAGILRERGPGISRRSPAMGAALTLPGNSSETESQHHPSPTVKEHFDADEKADNPQSRFGQLAIDDDSQQ